MREERIRRERRLSSFSHAKGKASRREQCLVCASVQQALAERPLAGSMCGCPPRAPLSRAFLDEPRHLPQAPLLSQLSDLSKARRGCSEEPLALRSTPRLRSLLRCPAQHPQPPSEPLNAETLRSPPKPPEAGSSKLWVLCS